MDEDVVSAGRRKICSLADPIVELAVAYRLYDCYGRKAVDAVLQKSEAPFAQDEACLVLEVDVGRRTSYK